MRQTLTRRQEQEHSQHSTSQKVRTEANSQGLRNILLEYLQRAIVVIEKQDDELVVEAGRPPFFVRKCWRHRYQKDSNSRISMCTREN